MTNITLAANHCWIDTTPGNLAKNFGNFGIYILGIKNANGRIVPYYVGKSEGSISSRVSKHIIGLQSPNTTYTIFSQKYYLGRGIGPCFIKRAPQPYSKKSYPSSAFGIDILYLGKDYFFNHPSIVGHPVPSINGERPLTLLNNYVKTKSLFSQSRIVQGAVFIPGSLYFTVINPNLAISTKPTPQQKNLLECIETFVKFSLKINTIGKSQSINTMNKNLNGTSLSINIPNIPCSDLRNEF